jgi:hypothetical protein
MRAARDAVQSCLSRRNERIGNGRRIISRKNTRPRNLANWFFFANDLSYEKSLNPVSPPLMRRILASAPAAQAMIAATELAINKSNFSSCRDSTILALE